MKNREATNDDLIHGVNGHILAILGDELPVLTKLKNYVVESGGKRVRSIVASYLASIFGISGNDSMKISAIVEIIHAASLLHDDVLDDANIRRGKPSGKKIFGSKEVILGGDYMFATAIRSLNDFENPGLMDIFTRVIRDLSIAELYQLEYEKKPDITLEIYLKIIYGKTGSLFQTACEAIAIHAERPEEEIRQTAEMGKKLGMLFQMRDDYLDYFNAELLQKDPYQDFENGLFTFPVLAVRDRMTSEDSRRLEKIFSMSESARKEEAVIREFLGLLGKYNAKKVCLEELDKMKTELEILVGKLPEHMYREKIMNQVQRLMQLGQD